MILFYKETLNKFLEVQPKVCPCLTSVYSALWKNEACGHSMEKSLKLHFHNKLNEPGGQICRLLFLRSHYKIMFTTLELQTNMNMTLCLRSSQLADCT